MEHAKLGGKNSASRRRRRTQPLEREDEEGGSNQINDLDDDVRSEQVAHGFFGPLALNIFSIRSVIRNPPTMLLVAATIAIVPRIFASMALCAWYSPAIIMAPTTAMASSAFVNDIRGVWGRVET